MESNPDQSPRAQPSFAADARGLASLAYPVLVLVASTALLASVSGMLGWHAEEMYFISTIAGIAVLLAVAVNAWLRVALRREAALALRASDERLGSIIDTAMDAIIAMDEQHTVILFNNAAERVFGYPRDAVVGRKLEMLIPERFRRAHAHHVSKFGGTGVTSRRMGDQTVLKGLRAGGEEFPIEASISQHEESGQKIYTVILRDVSLRVMHEEDLRQSREEIRELASASQTAREQERSRVARELHDEIGGALTALKMDTTWISERLPEGQPQLEEKLAIMRKMLDDTVAATRRISSDLRPMMLDDLGLAPAAEWLVHDFQRRTGIVCELAIALPEAELPGDISTAVFRLLQESLTNITKHARATHAEVSIAAEDGTLVLTVNDNGRGFNTATPRAPQSFGLIGMRERVSLLGGALRIESVPGDGTVLEARIPLPLEENAA